MSALRAAPFVEIRIPLEGSPIVRYFAMTGEDAERLWLWLASRPDLEALIREAAVYRRGEIQGPPGACDRRAT